jgi:plastocyanin
VALGAVLGALIAACSSGGHGPSEEEPGGSAAATVQAQPQPVQPAGEAVEPQDGVVEITIEGHQFRQSRIRLRTGEPVTIRVLNQDGDVHNLRIAGPDGEYQTEDDAVTSPEAIPPGEAGELTFAPQIAGEYTFRCDFFPGTMGGQIAVH